jgi:hypothetical protein
VSTDLAIVSNHAEYLKIPAHTSFEDWYEYRHQLEKLKKASDQTNIAVVFHTMDWLFWAEENPVFDQSSSQGTAFVEEKMGWDPATFSIYRRVWDEYPPGERVPGAGVSFYQAVLERPRGGHAPGLPPKLRRDLLELAVHEDWTRPQLRRSVKAHLSDIQDGAGDEEKKAASKREIISLAGELLSGLLPHEGGYRIADPETALSLAEAIGQYLLPPDIEGEAEAIDALLDRPVPDQRSFDGIAEPMEAYIP